MGHLWTWLTLPGLTSKVIASKQNLLIMIWKEIWICLLLLNRPTNYIGIMVMGHLQMSLKNPVRLVNQCIAAICYLAILMMMVM